MSAATLEELYKRASAGDMGALVEYAGRLMTGDGCVQNREGAVQCLEMAVGRGNGDAALQLGMCYAYGTGVDQDDRRSTEYYRKGAELGNAESMYRLFQNLSIGKGCTLNMDEADVWLAKAGNLGHARAQTTWKRLSGSGMLVRDLSEAARQNAESQARTAGAAREITAVIPKESLSLANMGLKDASETEIVDQTYVAYSRTKGSLGLIAVYVLCGVLSGILLRSVFKENKAVFNALTLYNYLGDVKSIVIYLSILGGVFGLVVGFFVSLAYKKSTAGIVFYIPVFLFPLILLLIGPPLMPLVISLGKLLYGLLTIVIGLIALYCVCATSSG